MYTSVCVCVLCIALAIYCTHIHIQYLHARTIQYVIIKYLRQPTATPYCPGIKQGMGRSQDVAYELEKSSDYFVNINAFKIFYINCLNHNYS